MCRPCVLGGTLRLEVRLEDVSTQAFYGVVERKYVYMFSVLDIETLVNVDEITKLDTQIVTRDFVHLNPAPLYVIRAQANQDRITSLFPLFHPKLDFLSNDVTIYSPYDDGVPTKWLEKLHCRGVRSCNYTRRIKKTY